MANDTFVIREDGTIVRPDGTTQRPRKKRINPKVIIFFIVAIAIALTIYISITVYTNREIDKKTRNLQDYVFKGVGRDYVYWTTLGTNTDLHLFNDCPEFHNMPVNEGAVVYEGVKYFVKERGEKTESIHICNECIDRAKQNNNSINP
ncbi:MAG: hypothetical protein LBH19_02115 [Dysgonamonadaceae bacterium]|jgi:hypothetical protein|nr:hypothetical protein [Dysgonamonadaceae bacterium]